MSFNTNQNKTLPCQKCNKNVPLIHYKIHTKECKGLCPINPLLAELFIGRIKLSMEVNKVKEEKKENTICKYCDKQFTIKEMLSHIYDCSKLEVNCPYCSNGYAAENLLTHIELCVQRFSKSYIVMKNNSCCNRLRRNSEESLINTEKEFIVQKLMRQLNLPKTHRNRLQKPDTIKKVFTQGICMDSCESIQQCVFCKVDFINKQNIQQVRCGHLFHNDCYQVWNHKSDHCPQCKQQFFQ